MGKDDKKKKTDRPLPEVPQGNAVPADQFDMVFHCQLAHGSPTRQVRDFTNVKQLYESIAKAHGIKTEEILYCTLNTHKVDMTRLLGGQIGLDDFLFAHVKGEKKTVAVNKDGAALGLTISDNGAGYAFIKKVREDSIMSKVKNVAVGDHIQAINGTDLTGKRHFDVAKMLKDIPIGSQFSMVLVEPRKAFDTAIAARGQLPATNQEVKAGGGKKTLRMKAGATATVEDEPTSEVTAVVTKIDELLEKFIGIRDGDLALTVHKLAVTATEPEVFAGLLDRDLTDFEFPDDFVLDVFELVKKK